MYIEQSKLPAKQVVSKIAFTNSQGEVLIARPAYKAGWVLIGGMNEKGESPTKAAVREIKEEIGLTVDPSRLRFAMMHYSPAIGRYAEHFVVTFAAHLDDSEIAAMQLAPQEITSYTFVEKTKLASYVTNISVKALSAMWAAGYSAGYGENGRFVVPVALPNTPTLA